MTPEQAAALRAPFPPEAIGKLPKVNCGACIKANKQTPGSTCEKHVKRKCDECGAWISAAHIHLDYVGHAATTDRLLEVDPEWTWEPVAVDGNGAPALASGGLWIRMTVGGVSRLGWGDGPDIKQMISDAIRNAAMRFGVALDLWSKEDLRAHDENAGDEQPRNRQTPPNTGLHASGARGGDADIAGTARSSSSSATSPPLGESARNEGVASSRPPAPDAAPSVSKARRETLKSKCVALNEIPGVSIADERDALHLPLVDSCSLEQIEAFEQMVDDIEKRLDAPFEKADA